MWKVFKMSKKRVLRELVLSSLVAVSVVTVAQAEPVVSGTSASADEYSVAIGHEAKSTDNTYKVGSIAIGNNANAKDSGIAIGNQVSTTDKNATYNNLTPENISIGNRVYTGEGVFNHGIGIGSDVAYGMNTVAIGRDINAVTMDSVVIGHGAKSTDGAESIAIGLNSAAGSKSIALGSNSKARHTSIALGEGSDATIFGVENSVALGSKSVANRTGLQATGVKTTSATKVTPWFVYAAEQASDLDKNAIKGTVKGSLAAVSVGNDNATRQIVNVAAGTALSDAVNVAQLKSVDNRLTKVNKDLTAEIGKVNVRVDELNTTVNNLVQNGDNNSQEIVNIKNEVITQGQTIEEHGKAIDDLNNQVSDLDGRVSDNTKSINDLDGRVTNNTNAISDLNDRFDSQSNAISGLNNRVDKLGTRINKIGAGAAALAGLHPLDFDDDSKLTFAAGFGAYKNEQAAALGAFYRPNENLMVSFATAVGNSENMYNAGLSFRFGDSSPYQGLSKAELVSALEDQSKDIAELKVKANEVDTVKAENAALNERLAKLEALLATR